MAFVGAAVVKQITDGLVRITGVSLDSSAAETNEGTIALFESVLPPDVRLPAPFKPRPYDLPDTPPDVTLQESVQCYFVYTAAGAAPLPISVNKTGTTPQDFLITLSTLLNAETGGDGGELEIYVRFH